MHRCLELAEKAAGYVAPNPLVGAVLVHDNKIIGEGFHRQYGGPHAEVNCIQSVLPQEMHLIQESTLYVSLEPCAHQGKTPPCTDLIIRNKIPRVIIGCNDPFVEVDGKGIEKLNAAGINTTTGILEKRCKYVNRRFLTFHTRRRPYIILKWAQTGDDKIGNFDNERLHITNGLTNRIVHKWRSEEAAILVGTNTAAKDNPQLTNRLWQGASPVRIILDPDLRLPPSLHAFDNRIRTIIFNTVLHEEKNNLLYYRVARGADLVHRMTEALYQLKIISVLVEGGAQLLQSFIDDGVWDEARVITNHLLTTGSGVGAPILSNQQLIKEENVESDTIRYYLRNI